MKKNVFLKAGILLLSLLLLPGLVGCSSSKQGRIIYVRTYGTVVSAVMVFTIEDASDNVIDSPVFTGFITVETDDGTRLDAQWNRRTSPNGGERVVIWTGGGKVNWQVERELSESDDLTLLNIVSVETDDGEIVDALWDEDRLGVPIVQSMGMTVKIEPTDNPDTWRVIKIVVPPQQ